MKITICLVLLGSALGSVLKFETTATDFCKIEKVDTEVGSELVSTCDIKYGTHSISANAQAIAELPSSETLLGLSDLAQRLRLYYTVTYAAA